MHRLQRPQERQPGQPGKSPDPHHPPGWSPGQRSRRWRGRSDLREENARAIEFRIRAPKELAKYIAHKGSITVDGTSLTVNAVNGAEFSLTIIPHTLSETIMGDYRPGRRVNLEVDLLARYLERLLLGDKAAEPTSGGISESFLAANGFLKS